MVAAPEYSLQTQSKIPLALAALHNLICIIDPDNDTDMDGDYDVEEMAHATAQINPDYLGSYILQAEKDLASVMGDNIASMMWEDYQRASS